jgi:hypothetical protein
MNRSRRLSRLFFALAVVGNVVCLAVDGRFMHAAANMTLVFLTALHWSRGHAE